MTKESVLNEVRNRLGPLSDQAEKAVAETLEIVRHRHELSFTTTVDENFKGENVSLQEYISWSDDQKRLYQSEAERINAKWIERKMHERGAMWLIVMDGRIVAHGPALRTFPYEEDFDELCERFGKYPFVFFSPRMFFIEESAAWHSTTIPGDAYPTLRMNLRADAGEIGLEADFDTGALDAYLDLDYFVQRGVMRVTKKNLRKYSSHLGRDYSYTTKSIFLEIKDKTGKLRQLKTNAICVENWRLSPFVAINPNRTALVGRDIMLQLQPLVSLDFARHQTQVEFR